MKKERFRSTASAMKNESTGKGVKALLFGFSFFDTPPLNKLDILPSLSRINTPS